MHAEISTSLPNSAPSTTMRRAFLFAGATFFAGAAIGGGGGFVLGLSGPAKRGAGSEVEVGPDLDEELEELHRLAVRAPIEELLEFRLAFLQCLIIEHHRDPVLWRGVDRLAEAVLRGVEIPERRLFAGWLAQVIERGDPEFSQRARAYVVELRRIR